MKCPTCNTEYEGESCPNCNKETENKKKKKPIYKKWWFWLIIVFVAVPVAAGFFGTEDSTSSTPATSESGAVTKAPAATTPAYTEVSLAQMCRDLDSNAMKADSTYSGKKVQFEAKITHIDESGTSIKVEALSGEYYTRVNCWVDEKHKSFLMEKKSGDIVLIKGKVTSVNSSFGYDIDAEYISDREK